MGLAKILAYLFIFYVGYKLYSVVRGTQKSRVNLPKDNNKKDGEYIDYEEVEE